MIYPLYPLNLRCFALAPAWDPRIPGRGVADHRRHESPAQGPCSAPTASARASRGSRISGAGGWVDHRRLDHRGEGT